ncbi:MAG: sugar phosphate isomerase/epimerase [Clostridia bacterium]|nr:sugar phosphate isomerase/epimerase [Clostridia bacterium]
MNIGYCAKPDQIQAVSAAGFDYIEPPVNFIAAMTPEDFGACLNAVQAAPIPAPSFNLLFPKTLSLLAPETTDTQIVEYLDTALERVHMLGGKVAVFGSGKGRNRAPEMSYDAAFRRLVEVTRLTGEVAEKHDVTIVIEPLNRGETNMINSLGEGACLVAAVNHPSVKLLADYYHIAVEHQPVEDISRLTGIAHAHIATEVGRRVPIEEDEGYRKMFAAMKETGYQGLISVEGKSDDLAHDGPVSVALLKKLWEEA